MIKLQKFGGVVPKIAAELLPDNSAQIAKDVKLHSGDLQPYSIPATVAHTDRTGDVKAIFELVSPDDGTGKWLSWTEDVDVVLHPSENNDQRFYYSGDGAPKVSDYDLATQGLPPYPRNSYDLGLDSPTEKLNVAEVALARISVSHYSRDDSDIATIETNMVHNYAIDDVVVISKLGSVEVDASDEDKELAKFNTRGSRIISVPSLTSFTYFSPGKVVSRTELDAGLVRLVGRDNLRRYVYTWVTPWGEESISSSVSNRVYVKDGQEVTVSLLPILPPSGNSFIRGFALYRTITSLNNTEYFRLGYYWFPVNVVSVITSPDDASKVILTASDYHNLIVGDQVNFRNSTPDTSIQTVTVSKVVSSYIFEYDISGTQTVFSVPTSGAYLAHVVNDTVFVKGMSTITDRIKDNELTKILRTDDYDKPPADLKGLTLSQDGILAGFVGNQVLFSEPGEPHAWPRKYRITLDYNIVALAQVPSALLVLTDGYSHVITGNDPATTTVTISNSFFPCLSKRSVVSMLNSVTWASHIGLASYSTSTGFSLTSSQYYDADTWSSTIDAKTIIATLYEQKYYASHSRGAFIFDIRKDESVLVNISTRFRAAHTSAIDNMVHLIEEGDSLNEIKLWDDLSQPFRQLEWRSKVIVSERYVNYGALRVIADFDKTRKPNSEAIALNTKTVEENEAVFASRSQFGSINSPGQTINSAPLGGEGYLSNVMKLNDFIPVILSLITDGRTIVTLNVLNDHVLRLPFGYRVDRLEVSIKSIARVRTVYIAESPYELMKL